MIMTEEEEPVGECHTHLKKGRFHLLISDLCWTLQREWGGWKPKRDVPEFVSIVADKLLKPCISSMGRNQTARG